MSIAERDLLKARKIAAHVVNQFGDRYWPIFELLDQEIAARRARQERIQSCLQPSKALEVRDKPIPRLNVSDLKSRSPAGKVILKRNPH